MNRCGWIIVLLLPMLVGCSTVRLSYNQGPLLAYWWLDGYADFNSEQAPKAKAALAQWVGWHRSTQLPDYADALADLQGQLADNVSPAQVCGQMQAWQKRIERAFDQAMPAAAEQLRSLTPEQIRHIERQQTQKLAEAEADFLQDEPAERHKALLKRNVDRAETLYGSLNQAQREVLAQAAAQSPFKPERWLAERRLRQQQTLRHLRQWQAERSDAATVQAGLRQWWAMALVSPRPAYQSYADSVTQANCALSAAVHNAGGPAQRQRAVAKLKGWEDDLRALFKR